MKVPTIENRAQDLVDRAECVPGAKILAEALIASSVDAAQWEWLCVLSYLRHHPDLKPRPVVTVTETEPVLTPRPRLPFPWDRLAR